MDNVRSPIYVAEPYEESQGKDSPQVSPDVLAAFYKDMERKDIERKLSKRKSNSGTSKLWSRKSLKRSATAAAVPSPAQVMQPQQTNDGHLEENETRENGEAEVQKKEVEGEGARTDKPDWQAPSPRSVIPDSKDLPAWHNKDIWAAVPAPAYSLRYPIHDPVGPRWYRNHHLIPPSEMTPAARPPSFFSPSFPPMTFSSSQDRPDDANRLPGPSRTPSNSPLPTPNSSQTRVIDKPRSRKTSQTAHDNVDLLDVTDPWGTNWHHHSPYDVGLVNGPISVDVQDPHHSRLRRASIGAPSKKYKNSPSPLSQSASAVHLERDLPDTGAHMARKLSKRRTPNAGNIFKSHSEDIGRGTVSLPTSPVENTAPTDLPKRLSVAPPVVLPTVTKLEVSPRKEKRGSVLGRLAKKFTVLKKTTSDFVRAVGREDDWQDLTVTNDPSHRSFLLERQPSPEKPNAGAVKRVPPPAMEDSTVGPDVTIEEADRSSSLSLETPYSMGRLTIANPDAPGSGQTTPAPGEIPLPPDKEPSSHPVSPPDEPALPSLPVVSPFNMDTLALPPESPLPPPVPLKEPLEPSRIPRSTSKEPPFSDHRDSPQLVSQSAPLQTTTISHAAKTSLQGSSLSHETITMSSSHPRETSSRKPTQTQVKASVTPEPILPEKSTAPGSVVSSVPFPGADVLARDQPSAVYDYTPLSAISMLANPPTPYSNEMSMPSTPNDPPPALPTKSRANTSAVSQSIRHTETFKLVRSPSGHIYAANETIVAGGQQWEVVGTSGENHKGSSNSKDRSSQSRKLTKPDPSDRHHKDRDTSERDVKSRDFRDRDRDARDHDTKERNIKDRDARDREPRDRDARDRHARDRDVDRDARDRNTRERESKDKRYKSHDRRRGHDYEARDAKERVSRDRNHDDYDAQDRRHKDHESSRRLEKKRESKRRSESESHYHHGRREQRPQLGERSTSTSKITTQVVDVNSRHGNDSTKTHQQDTKPSSRPREEPDKKLQRNQTEASPHPPNSVEAQASSLSPIADAPSQPLGRQPSLSARPTSELPSADEMNAMRAKEAWEMERLWKARSMQADEFNRYTTIPSTHNTPVLDDDTDANLHGAAYGSSHTAFVVQTPFRNQNSIYHSMPTAPPPIIYSSSSLLPTISPQPPTKYRGSPQPHLSDANVSDQVSYNSSRTYNPLPAPPRESRYEIPSDSRSSDFWAKHADIAASAN